MTTFDPPRGAPASDDSSQLEATQSLKAGTASDVAGPRETAADAPRRRRTLIAVAWATVFFTLGGLVASLFIKSPADRLAETAPPPPSVITAPLEERVVADTVTTRGRVVATQEVSALPSGIPSGVQRAVVSAVRVRLGQSISSGAEVVEISGQPVFALKGQVPAYRDLVPGSVGPDVAQLQSALREIGLQVSDPSGVYGSATGKAVSELRARNGYTATGDPTLTPFPSTSVVFVSRFPARITRLEAEVGQDAQSAAVVIASGQLGILVQTDAATAGLLRTGQVAEVTSEILGKTVTGRLSGSAPVETDPATSDASPSSSAPPTESDQAYLRVIPDAPLPVDWAGQDVRVVVASGASKTAVLAAPVSAVSAGGDGQTSVVVVDESGHQRRVAVKIGVTGSGFVEITSNDGGLAPDDRVLVGKAVGP